MCGRTVDHLHGARVDKEGKRAFNHCRYKVIWFLLEKEKEWPKCIDSKLVETGKRRLGEGSTQREVWNNSTKV